MYQPHQSDSRSRRRAAASAARVTPAAQHGHANADPPGERAPCLRFWRPMSKPYDDVLLGEFLGRALAIGLHEEVRLVLPSATTCVVDGRGRKTLAPAGSVVVTNPSAYHALLPLTGVRWHARLLLVRVATLARAWEEAIGRRPDATPHFPRAVILDAELASELATAVDALRSPVRSADCEPRLVRALGRLAERHATPPRLPPSGGPRRRAGVQRLHAYLREHVADPLSLDQMAGVAGLSKYYLLRAFEREYGIPPRAYHMALRVARARALIAAGMSPSRATFDAGFADHSHLTRRFKASTGMRPSDFARQLLAPFVDGDASVAIGRPVLVTVGRGVG
jgi:AraC-like DNA-binding protein